MTATKKSVTMLLVFVFTPALLSLTGCHSSTSQAPAEQSAEKLTVALTKAFQLSTLILIAKERGYFADQGLDITFKISESGHIAVQELLDGQAYLATASEFAAVSLSRKRPDLRIISILDTTVEQQLVARKDRCISGIQDLRKKRVGVTLGSSSEYYLHVCLILNKIPYEEIRTVDLLPSEQAKAIARGDIDAMIVWEPFATLAKEELGNNGASWSVPGAQREYWLLIGLDETIKQRSSAIRRVLAALASAEDFVKDNEAEAVRLVESRLGDRRMGDAWKNHDFRLGLDRLLLLKMESQLRWLYSRQATGQARVPDVLDLLYVDGLRTLGPERVRIVY